MSQEEHALARKRMVEEQIIARGIREPRVLAAMHAVPRHRFVPPDDLAWAYADGPLPIGYGQTISQPYIVALMTEMLEVKPDDRILEIGTGSGYQAAVLAELADEVHTVEVIPELSAPQPLLDQLAEGGQMVIPVGSRAVQQLEVWKRTGKRFSRRIKLAVCFVPLRGKYGWI
jgi:protein-L-isoaspartate(D-aspartate) O-methyltransferase